MNEIRPNRRVSVREHVISRINMIKYKIALVLCAKHFACQKYVVF